LVLGTLGACIGQVYLTAAARELARYKLDLVGVQEVRWDRGGTVRAGDCIFTMERKRKSSIGNRSFCTPQNFCAVEEVTR
jgi:hypothetical protein